MLSHIDLPFLKKILQLHFGLFPASLCRLTELFRLVGRTILGLTGFALHRLAKLAGMRGDRRAQLFRCLYGLRFEISPIFRVHYLAIIHNVGYRLKTGLLQTCLSFVQTQQAALFEECKIFLPVTSSPASSSPPNHASRPPEV